MNKFLQILQPYKAPLIGLLIAPILIYLAWDSDNSFFTILGIVGLITGVWALLTIPAIMDKQKEEENPYYFDDLVIETREEKWLQNGSIIAVISGLFSLFISTFLINNLINKLFFFIFWIVLGVFIASLFGWILKKWKPHIFIDNEQREKQLTCLWLSAVFYTIVLGITLTFFAPVLHTKTENAILLKHGSEKSEPDSSIEVEYQEKSIELRAYGAEWNALKDCQTVRLVIQKSILGFEYVSEIKPGKLKK